MSNARIYVEDLKDRQDSFLLSAENSKIAKSVLRLKKGEQIELVDGKGSYCPAMVEKFSREGCYVKCKNREVLPDTSYPKITLIQAFPKGKRIDFVIQKAVELGIDRIIFFQAKRCVSVVNKSEEVSKAKRFEKIAIEALRQCKRLYLPEILIKASLKDCIELVDGCDLKLCLHEDRNGTRLRSWLSEFTEPGQICFSIGPEGGLTDSEVVQFVGAGFKQVKLGEEVLRTETAPITVLSILNYLFRW